MPLAKSRLQTNGSTIGADFMNSNTIGGTRNNSISSFNRMRPGTTGNNSNNQLMQGGVEMYYGNRRGGSASFNKRNVMRKNGSQSSLAAIQNTQNKLVASLNINNKNTMMRNHNGMNGQRGGIAATMDQKQQEMYNTLNAIRQHSNNTSSYQNSNSLTSLSSKRFGPGSLYGKDNNDKNDGIVTSAALAAAAAANVVKENAHQKQQRDQMLEQQRNAQKMLSSDNNGISSNIRVKKNVRWNTTIATIASAESNENAPPSHRENDAFSAGVISILAVGGKEKERNSIYSTTSNIKTPKGKKKFLQQLNSNTDSAAATIMSASNSMTLLANIKDNQNTSINGMRPHTSGSLESGLGHRGGARGKHAAILEIRRNNNNNNNNIDNNTNNLSQNSIGSTNSVASERPQRPSLSEQLAAITANASNITKDIRSKHGLDSTDDLHNPPLVTLPAKSFSVGTLCCRYPSPTRYYKDRLEYTFHHPYENSEVLMIMYYADMLQTALTAGRLKFKISRKLIHFASDFDPNNPMHVISIELGTTAASTIVRDKILPLIGGGNGTGYGRFRGRL